MHTCKDLTFIPKWSIRRYFLDKQRLLVTSIFLLLGVFSKEFPWRISNPRRNKERPTSCDLLVELELIYIPVPYISYLLIIISWKEEYTPKTWAELNKNNIYNQWNMQQICAGHCSSHKFCQQIQLTQARTRHR